MLRRLLQYEPLTRVTLVGLLFAGTADLRAEHPAPTGATDDSSHVMLMLDRTPLHLVFRVRLEDKTLDENRRLYAANLLTRLDTNNDGKLMRSEAAASPLLRQGTRELASDFLATLAPAEPDKPLDVDTLITRLVGETMTYRQDDSATQSDSNLFDLLDVDASGLLDAEEMAAAAEKLMELDTDSDDCVGFDEVQPPDLTTATNVLGLGVDAQTEPEVVRPAFSDLIRDFRDPLLPRRMLRKYDRDRDGRLTADELQWTFERVAELDRNGDSALSTVELRDLINDFPDLSLEVELLPAGGGAATLRVVGEVREGVDVTASPQSIHACFAESTITFTCASDDPLDKAVRSARVSFNRLDLDGNGYLDTMEVEPDVRLRRGLFAAMDTDGDGKLLGEELETYVRECGEPASKSCRVNIHDTGSGFFQRVDANSDGRLSHRELKQLQSRLASLDLDEHPGLSLEEPPRHFHIEFVRSSYSLFGPASSFTVQAPSFQRSGRSGPIWFQRMDRNNDGDLTWKEFLGHRADFVRFDVDGDGLIDPQEAVAAAP